MEFESIKTVLLAITVLIILYIIFFKGGLSSQKLKFMISSFSVTLILILIIILKLHHFLRLQLSIPNTLTYFLTAIIFFLHFLFFRREIIKTNFIILVLSIGFIFCAVLLDLLTDGKIITLPESDLIEEIFRIAGTGLWMFYYLNYSIKLRDL